MKRWQLVVAVILSAVCGGVCLVAAEVKLPAVFGDNMVLQQGRPVPVWGWAAPGEAVTVKIAGQEKSATADAQGKWRVSLDPLHPGEPLTMAVAGTNTITLKNILVGEVWVCSGQSNMWWTVALSANAAEEINNSRFPGIRFFQVGFAAPDQPAADCTGKWVECGPETVGNSSAVSYYFGRKLHQELGVPVGLIQTSVGGTPAESWTSEEALLADPELAVFIERKRQALAEFPGAQAKYEAALAEYNRTGGKDPASQQDDSTWAKPECDDANWSEMKLPQQWEPGGLQMDGVVWFRTAIEIPAEWEGKDLALKFGPIDDQDITFFNGVEVGAMGPETPSAWTKPRNYTVPGRIVKPGRAVLAVKNTDMAGAGGLLGQPEEMSIGPADGTGSRISLATVWKYRIAARLMPKPVVPLGPGNSWLPTALYNGMITPLVPYAVRGAIWYQGESNADRAYQYRKLFPAMINDWRKQWADPELFFVFVQLANFTGALPEPRDSEWAELREAQTMTLALPNTGMAVAIDIGDAADIHPKNKQDVGLRLALWPLAKVHGRSELVYSGPIYESMVVEGGKIRIKFNHIGGGLVAKGGTLKLFAIAGADKKFVWAEAVIDGDTVVVSSPQVPDPVAVRYAWAHNPDGCNLYNAAGLPASPFRTDDWPGLTADKR